MQRFIASDYDGTLNLGGTVSNATVDAIAAWQQDGNRFGLVTGRSIGGILPEIERYGIPYDFLVCNNGCEIYGKDRQLLYRAPSDPSVLPELCRYIIAADGLHVAVSFDSKRFCIIYPGQNTGVIDPSKWNSGDVWIPLDEVESFSYFTQVDTHFDCDADAAALAENLSAQFGDRINAHQNGLNVDVVPYGVSKPHGLDKLLELLGADSTQLITVGDNFNDLSMLHAFDGYVIESGNPAVVAQIQKRCRDIPDLIEQFR